MSKGAKMNMHTELASPEDARPLIDFMNRVGGETDNLSFGEGEFMEQDAEREAAFLAHQRDLGGFTLLAWSDRSRKQGGPQLLGMCSVDMGERPRMRHRAELALVVSKRFWGEGVGTRLMQECIGRVTEAQEIEVLVCEVRSDNKRAIRLYERFGLEQTGTLTGFTKVGGQLYDAVAMSRVFHRERVQTDGPLFYLDDILEAIDFTNDNVAYYACLDTGEIELYFHDNWAGETDFDPETAEGRWEPLPSRHEIDDWHCMQEFAYRQEEYVCERLLDLIHRRGAYRNFKNECARRGLLNDYFAFQESWHRRVAIDWLEAHDCAWTEGMRPR